MAGSAYRRRRVIWSLILFALGTLIYLGTQSGSRSWSLPSYLKEIGLSSSSSPARLVADAKNDESIGAGRPRIQEIHGLLHFVTAYPGRRLNEHAGKIHVVGLGEEVEVDGNDSIDLRVFSPDGSDDWQSYVKVLREDHPLVVFSKSYCPYSKRAKALLSTYELSPPPTIIELDLRSDAPIIQNILKRLTGRATVPNILLQGISIGGSDTIQELDDKGELRKMLEEGGLSVTRS
ncbi:glutaredoxin [Irpex rosettiformis]|uniref:Glutaredoxin n=1 Tax=Irpex rosettiformis TaxID=378272 RepID=A0ACB8TS35_9APHY|nr:glutaredoxin [Irpex rosettiformis]